MGSPTPFSTWTMGTTGPVWAWFIAVLGSLGFPLTVLSTHLLAAVLVGVMGFIVVILLWRSLGAAVGVSVGLLCWLLYVLVRPLGGLDNFAAMNTEMLPTVLVLGAALVPPNWLGSRPWLFLIVGLLCGLAIGAKYQVAPVAFALVLARLIEIRPSFWRFVRLGLIATAGVAVPFVVAALMMLFDPRFEPGLFRQWVEFLTTYSSGLGFPDRVRSVLWMMLPNAMFWVLLALIIWASIRSSTRINILRWVTVALAGLAVFLGGFPYAHYMIIGLGGMVIAAGLPLKTGAQLLPGRRARTILVGVVAGVGIATTVTLSLTSPVRAASPDSVALALSPGTDPTIERLAAACPPGTPALVWGWAPELYLAYGWRSTFPSANIYAITHQDSAREGLEPFAREALEQADCVIDAVGQPFFGIAAHQTITNIYPWSGPVLSEEFRLLPDAFACEACSVYVRR